MNAIGGKDIPLGHGPTHAAGTTIRATFALLRADLDRAVSEYAALSAARPVRGWRRLMHLALPCMICVILFRLAHWCHGHGLRFAAGVLALLNRRLTGAQIQPASLIGPGLFVPHPAAVTLCCRAGRNLRVLPLAAAVPTILPGWRGELPADTPDLGDGVTLGAFALVLGGVRVGDAALVGVHAAITADLRPGSVSVVPRHWRICQTDTDSGAAMSVPFHAEEQSSPAPLSSPSSLAGHGPGAGTVPHTVLAPDPGLRALNAADRAALEAHLGRRVGWWQAGRMAIRLQRLGHAALRRGWKGPSRLIWATNLLLTGADLENAAVFGPGCVIAAPRGVIIYGDLGAGCVLGTRVALGGVLRGLPKEPGMRVSRPDVGAGCMLADGSTVLGSINIGAGSRIGPGCMVLSDLPAGATIVTRLSAWRTIRVDMPRCPRPPLPAQPTLLATLRSDLVRMVNENATGEPPAGGLRFWSHLILPPLQGVMLFRLSHALHAGGWRRGAALLARVNKAVYGLAIHPASEIGPAMFCPHTVGVSFCGRAGPLLSLFPYCYIGPENWPDMTADMPADSPVLGSDVGIGANAEVVGTPRLGDGVMVGVAARVERDIAAGLAAVPRRNWTFVTQDGAGADAGSGRGDIAGMQPQTTD